MVWSAINAGAEPKSAPDATVASAGIGLGPGTGRGHGYGIGAAGTGGGMVLRACIALSTSTVMHPDTDSARWPVSCDHVASDWTACCACSAASPCHASANACTILFSSSPISPSASPMRAQSADTEVAPARSRPSCTIRYSSACG
jgi:hypothetical protein